MKISDFFLSVKFLFIDVKFSIYLNRCVFAMAKSLFFDILN